MLMANTSRQQPLEYNHANAPLPFLVKKIPLYTIIQASTLSL